MSSSQAQNLERIVQAMEQHDQDCPFPLTGVALSPFEAERLGWDVIRGVPIVVDEKLPTGRFRLICGDEFDEEPSVETEKVKEFSV